MFKRTKPYWNDYRDYTPGLPGKLDITANIEVEKKV